MAIKSGVCDRNLAHPTPYRRWNNFTTPWRAGIISLSLWLKKPRWSTRAVVSLFIARAFSTWLALWSAAPQKQKHTPRLLRFIYAKWCRRLSAHVLRGSQGPGERTQLPLMNHLRKVRLSQLLSFPFNFKTDRWQLRVLSPVWIGLTCESSCRELPQRPDAFFSHTHSAKK
jgi:hypothetical protein